ncbi:MAG TPA: zf-TFIIB domain-containing protein [Verrucomicrobiae bacterium]|nr:zf-TFIIB domain-containing protein [Verrucomicrobiae bacterium]
MKCPRCQAEMEEVKIEGEVINRCTQCHGLWFDEFELDDLKGKPGSESIDTGSARPGQKPNKGDRIRCPKCGEPMIRLVDNDHPHIWYETCEICSGSFLDAGEFRHMQKANLLDKLKDVFAEMRGRRERPSIKLSHAVMRKILQ